MIHELDTVVLEADRPEAGLRRGDVGTVVLVHGEGEAYEVEFITLDGSDMTVVTVEAGQLRPAHEGEIAAARDLDRRRFAN